MSSEYFQFDGKTVAELVDALAGLGLPDYEVWTEMDPSGPIGPGRWWIDHDRRIVNV